MDHLIYYFFALVRLQNKTGAFSLSFTWVTNTGSLRIVSFHSTAWILNISVRLEVKPISLLFPLHHLPHRQRFRTLCKSDLIKNIGPKFLFQFRHALSSLLLMRTTHSSFHLKLFLRLFPEKRCIFNLNLLSSKRCHVFNRLLALLIGIIRMSCERSLC